MYKIVKKTNEFALVENTITTEIYKLDLINSHSEFGNIYIFSNILNMPAMRREGYNLISQYEQIGVESTEVESTATDVMTMIETKEQGWENRAYTELFNLKARVKDFWNYKKTSMFIVGLLCIPENELEMIGSFNQQLVETNIELWSKDSALFDFFLSKAQIKTNNLYNTLDIDTKQYLEEMKTQTQSQKTTPKNSSLYKRLLSRFKN